MVQCVSILGWVSQFICRWCAIEMGNLTIYLRLYLVYGEWQADAFPCSRGFLGIVHRLAHIPGMLGYREWDRGAEVVVDAIFILAVLSLWGALHEMEIRGGEITACTIACSNAGFIGYKMMTLNQDFFLFFIIVECRMNDIVSLGCVCLFGISRFCTVCCGIYQEVLGNFWLDHEVVVLLGIVGHWRIEDAMLADALREVVLASKVYRRCRWLIHVCTPLTLRTVVGIVMEGIELGVSVITGCAIYTVGHVIYMSGSNLGRIVVWSQLQ